MNNRRVATIILTYKYGDMTDALVRQMQNLSYKHHDIYVIDNQSPENKAASTTHTNSKNYEFTRGMMEGYRIAKQAKEYDAYWWCNNDIQLNYGFHVLSTLMTILFEDTSYGQISPEHNSPHAHMTHVPQRIYEVPFIECTATLVKAQAIQDVGIWDEDLIYGFGVDYDYGHRMRQHEYKNIVTNAAKIRHAEHTTVSKIGGRQAKAAGNMNRVLTQKYGEDWERIIQGK